MIHVLLDGVAEEMVKLKDGSKKDTSGEQMWNYDVNSNCIPSNELPPMTPNQIMEYANRAVEDKKSFKNKPINVLLCFYLLLLLLSCITSANSLNEFQPNCSIQSTGSMCNYECICVGYSNGISWMSNGTQTQNGVHNHQGYSQLIIPATTAHGTNISCEAFDSDGHRLHILSIIAQVFAGPVENVTVPYVSSSQLTVAWTPPTTGAVPSSYNVSINGSISPVSILHRGSFMHNYTFTGLLNDMVYYISVMSVTCAGTRNAVTAVIQTLPHPPNFHSINAISVFYSNNTICQVEITWMTVGGSVTAYGVYVADVLQDTVTCTTKSLCFYVLPLSRSSTRYNISLASINGGGMGPRSDNVMYGAPNSNDVIRSDLQSFTSSMAIFACTSKNTQSFYCMVCCSTNKSVPPDSSVYNISTTRGTNVIVTLQGLTTGQVYYCKAAASNTNFAKCGGEVIGDVSELLSAKESLASSNLTSPTSASGASKWADNYFVVLSCFVLKFCIRD